ncbi:unnamed protein product [Parnassius mnemosyne]|uniref:C2H2-type domain-containing protein n=1 Tax=Parnassius mnemosyne TaxID=213953 RepID=A0AAV1LGN3_9NEOP
MNSKLNKSGVLTSHLDYFCLVCECRFDNEDETFAHITKKQHKTNISLTEYFEGKNEHCVRKIKKWYYCEVCNVLLSTSARVRLHIIEPSHIEIKNTKLMGRQENFVVALTNVLIDDKAWNGFIDDTCVICNTEFDNEDIHKNESNHIIKLIQTKVEFDSNKNIFRKIDESSFQCLTCNAVVAWNTNDFHFDKTEHLNLYNENCKSAENKTSKVIEKPDITDKKSKNQQQNEEVVLEEIKVPDNALNTKDKARVKNINNNPESTIENSGPIDDTKICEILKAKNYITTDEKGMTWCILCNWVIEAFAVNAHLNDLHHQTMLRLHKQRISKLNIDKKSKEISKNKNDNVDKITTQNMDSNENLVDSVDKFQKEGININFESKTVDCKKCSKGLEFDMQLIEKHVEEHTKTDKQKNTLKSIQLTSGLESSKGEEGTSKNTCLYTTPVLIKKTAEKKQKKENEEAKNDKESSPPSDIEDLDNFVKENNMKYIGKNKIHCNKCNTDMSSSLKNIKEHVAGLAHNKKNEQDLEITNSEPKQKQPEENCIPSKIPMELFVHSAITINGVQKDIVLNEKICINLLSFLLFVKYGNRLRCLGCKSNLRYNNYEAHKDMPHHKDMLSESYIIIEDETEFIREIHPGNYHCGYCNILESSWQAMKKHLKTNAHIESKTAAQWRLQQYLPEIHMHRFQREMQERFMMEMFLGRMFHARNREIDFDSD